MKKSDVMKTTDGRMKQREGMEPSYFLKQGKCFTLIELLVIAAQHCRDFISKVCTVSSQNTPDMKSGMDACATDLISAVNIVV